MDRVNATVRTRFSYAAFFGAFLLGLGSRLEYQIIGYLPFTEIGMLIAMPFLLPRLTSTSVRQRTRLVIPLAFFWLVNLFISDIYRETDWSLAARGAARIVIFLIAIPFFVYFLRKDVYEKLVGFYAGATISAVLSGFVFKSGARAGRAIVFGTDDLTWETHWGPVLLLGLALSTLLLYRRSHLLAYGVCATCGIIQLVNGSRSIAGMLLLGPLLTLVLNVTGIQGGSKRLVTGSRALQLLLVAAVGLMSAYAVVTAYSWSAESGMLGERAYTKYMSQSRNRFGLIFGGRGDVVAAGMAIADSPLIGQGSWPKDRNGYLARACELTETKLPQDFYRSAFPIIPSHSHVMQAWMEGGIMGGVFWLYVLVIIAIGLASQAQDREKLLLWACVVATSLVWNILFSPISARVDESLLVAFFLTQMLPWPGSSVSTVK